MSEEIKYWFLILDGKFVAVYSDLRVIMGIAYDAVEDGHHVEVLTNEQWLKLTEERERNILEVLKAVEAYGKLEKEIYITSPQYQISDKLRENQRNKYNEIVGLIQKL